MPLIKKKGNLHQAISMIPVFLLLFLSGATVGWLPVTLYHLNPLRNGPVSITKDQGSWLASLQQFGRLLTTIPTGLMMDAIGRKHVILMAAVIFFSGWLISFVVFTLDGLVISNLVVGLALGMAGTNCQIYTAEIVSADVRGIFHAINSFSYNLGFVAVGTMGNFLTYQQMASVIFTCACLTLILSYPISETPYYLTTKGDRNAARRALNRLRTGVKYQQVEREFDEIERTVNERTENNGKTISFKRLNDRRFFMVLFLNSASILTGFLAIRLHSTHLLPTTDLIRNPVQYPLIIACVQLASSFLSPFVIERYPRRTLYAFSTVLMTIVLAITGTLFYYKRNYHYDAYLSTLVDTILLLLISTYYVNYGALLITLLFISRGELLPQTIRASGSGIITLFQAGSSVFAILLFQFIDDRFGVYVNFFVCSSVSAIIGLTVYFYLPETRGLTLATIQRNEEPYKEQRRSSNNPNQFDKIVDI